MAQPPACAAAPLAVGCRVGVVLQEDRPIQVLAQQPGQRDGVPGGEVRRLVQDAASKSTVQGRSRRPPGSKRAGEAARGDGGTPRRPVAPPRRSGRARHRSGGRPRRRSCRPRGRRSNGSWSRRGRRRRPSLIRHGANVAHATTLSALRIWIPLAGHDRLVRQSDEQAVLDHAEQALQLGGEPGGVGIGPKRQSRMTRPSSVTSGWPSALRSDGTAEPADPGRRSGASRTARRRPPPPSASPSRETSLERSAMMQRRPSAAATSFSRSSAPPPPLMRSRPPGRSRRRRRRSDRSSARRELGDGEATAARHAGYSLRGRHRGGSAGRPATRSASASRNSSRSPLPSRRSCRPRPA